jgi:two-component system, chemotaxis family, chemotaxis protein CheY
MATDDGSSKRSPSVLIVEDDPELGDAISSVVTEIGCRPIRASNGREALAKLETESPALMLVDIFMPVMNGMDFLQATKRSAKWRHIPRVIMTGINDPMIGVKQDVPVLFKPIDAESLSRMVREHCQAAARGATEPPDER